MRSRYFLMLFVLLFPWSAAAGAGEAHFAFHDEATFAGRSVLHFRGITLKTRPLSDVPAEGPFDADSRFGLLQVGDGPGSARAFVWSGRDESPSKLWFDADGDGRLAANEQLDFAGTRVEVPVTVRFSSDDRVGEVTRTLVIRRAAFGGGLQYAIRGYRTGTLRVGGGAHRAVLIDGNADGLLHGPGEDRIWIDLNDDGVFDGFGERFPLGKPIHVAGEVYAVSADATGERVRACRRSDKTGRLRLTLFERGDPAVQDFSATLVSDIGELVRVTGLDEPTALPVAAYRVKSLAIRLKDSKGLVWSYVFGGRGRPDIVVRQGRETRAALLSGVKFELRITPLRQRSILYDELSVSPQLVSERGLYLGGCTAGERTGRDRAATISLLSGDGKKILDVQSGFA